MLQASESILACIQTKFMSSIAQQLDIPLIAPKLLSTMRQMARGRNPQTHEIIQEFYYKFWDLTNHDFTTMVSKLLIVVIYPQEWPQEL